MKKISMLFVVLVVALISCKKTPDVNVKYVEIESEEVTVDSTGVTFQCIYNYVTDLKEAYLYYGEGEDQTDMDSIEMQIIQDTLRAELTDLQDSTTYSYYYRFDNGFNSMRTELKTFQTN